MTSSTDRSSWTGPPPNLEYGVLPRVGDLVYLHRGGKYRAVQVTTAKMILESSTEEQAFVFGNICRSRYGPNWLNEYYQVELIDGERGFGSSLVVEPHDVLGIERFSGSN